MCSWIFGVALSAHLGLVGDYNAVHPQVKCEPDQSGFIAGAYWNSEKAVSVFAGWKLRHDRVWLESGIVTGYSDAPVMPFARAGVDLNDRSSLFVAPAYENIGGDERFGAVLGYEVRF